MYAPQIEACDRLLDAAWGNRPDGVEIAGPTDVRIVYIHQFGRATQSYRAATLLSREGLVYQALMICRSLYEDTIATLWALLPENRDTVMGRVSRQERHWDEMYLRKIDQATGRSRRDAPTDDEWNELEREFSGGGKSWFGRLNKARDQVAAHLPSEERETLDVLSDHVNSVSNMTLHHTVMGLIAGNARPLGYKGLTYFDYGRWRRPNEELMSHAFFAAPVCYGWIVSAVLIEFGIDPLPVATSRQVVYEAERVILA